LTRNEDALSRGLLTFPERGQFRGIFLTFPEAFWYRVLIRIVLEGLGLGKLILLCAVSIFSLVPVTALASPDEKPIDLTGWLDALELPTGVETLRSTTGLIPLEPGASPYIYVRVLPLIDVIDGGPNIAHADFGSPAYKDAFSHAFGMNVEVSLRFIPNIYLVISGGMALFDGHKTLTTVDGYDLVLEDMGLTYLTIGGTFMTPIALLTRKWGKVDDLQGLQVTFSFAGGAVFQPALKMLITDSPPPPDPDLTGTREDFWKRRIGFCGSVHVGIDYRVGPFSLLLDVGVKTYGKPLADTPDPTFSAGEAMVIYPLRFGFCYRF
jgi:hypothetical protein